MTCDELREDWDQRRKERGGKADAGLTIVSTFLDLRGDQLQGIEKILGKQFLSENFLSLKTTNYQTDLYTVKTCPQSTLP